MAAADGTISKSEVDVIFLILNQYGIIKDTVESVLIETLANDMEPVKSIEILSRMTNDQKKYVCGYLAAIMLSDGDINDKEVALWTLVSTMAKFPEMTMREAVDFIANN